MAFEKKTWKARKTEYPNRRRLTMEDGTAELVTVSREEGIISEEGDAFSPENMNDLETRIETEFNELKKSVSDGKTAVASAITGQGVSTAADATFDTMATNIEAIKTSEGTARVAQVLAGYTFTNDNGGPWNGTMTNRGAWTGATTGSGNVAIPAGYHNGSGYVSGAGAYSAGVTAADARVNTASASYSAGVNAGKAQLPNITTVYNCVTSDAGNNQTHDLYIYIPSGYNYLTLTASASMSYNCQISFGAYGNGATALSSGNGTTSFSKESTKIYVGGYSYVMLRMSTPAAKGTVNMSSVLSVA